MQTRLVATLVEPVSLPALADSLAHDGYAVINNYFNTSTGAELLDRARELALNFELSPDSSVFSTRTHQHAADQYFLGSAHGVKCFLEEEALTEEGTLRQSLPESINKIGHALHKLDSVYAPFSQSKSLRDIARAAGVEEPTPIQSMIIFKQPNIGGEVVWHQDATFLYTEPSSVVGFWFALEDATRENGCLEVLTGAHLQGLKRRFLREGDALRFEELDDHDWEQQTSTFLEVPAGTLVVLHGLLPHRSAPNRSPHSRTAYSLHMIDRRCSYADTNWLRLHDQP